MDENTSLVNTYLEYAQSIYRFCLFKTGNREQAEDITSETFLKFAQQDTEAIENQKAWLFTVARNTMYDMFRKKKPTSGAEEIIENISPNVNTIEEVALQESQLEELKSHISTLDETTSEIILLKVWEEMTFDAIANVMDLSVSATKMKYYRGIETVKSTIQSKGKSSQLRGLVSIPLVLGGIATLGAQSSYAMPGAFAQSITATILSITGSSMIGIGATAAGAATAVGSAGTSAAAGILSTTAAKIAVAVVGTTALVSGGVGTALIVREQNQQQEVPTETTARETSNCEIKTYKNPTYPELSFTYDSCEWEVTVQSTDSESIMPPIHTVQLSHDSGIMEFEIQPLEVFGFGPSYCTNDTYQIIPGVAERLGRFTTENNTWAYSQSILSINGMRQENGEAFLQTIQTISGEFNPNQDGYCDAWPATTISTYEKTNGEPMEAIVRVTYQGDSNGLLNADKVIKTIQTTDNTMAEDCSVESYTHDAFQEFTLQYDTCEWEIVSEVDNGKDGHILTLRHQETGEPVIFDTSFVAYMSGYGYTCHKEPYTFINDSIARSTIQEPAIFGTNQLVTQYVPIRDPFSPNNESSRSLISEVVPEEPNCAAGQGEFHLASNYRVTEEELSTIGQLARENISVGAQYTGMMRIYAPGATTQTVQAIDTLVQKITFGNKASVGESCTKETFTLAMYPDFSFEYDSCEWELNTKSTPVQFLPNTEEIRLTQDNASLKITLQPNPVFGFGPPTCFNNSSYFLFDRKEDINGRFIPPYDAVWKYGASILSIEEAMQLYDREFFLEQMYFQEVDINQDGYCNPERNTTPTQYPQPETGPSGYGKFISALVDIRFEGDESYLENADVVMKTLNLYNPVQTNAFVLTEEYMQQNFITKHNLVQSRFGNINNLKCRDGFADTEGELRLYRIEERSDMISATQHSINFLQEDGWEECNDTSGGEGIAKAYRRGDEVIFVQAQPEKSTSISEAEQLHYSFNIHARY